MDVLWLCVVAYVVAQDVDSPDSVDTLDADLRKLARLKNDGLINEQEFEQKQAEILRLW